MSSCWRVSRVAIGGLLAGCGGSSDATSSSSAVAQRRTLGRQRSGGEHPARAGRLLDAEEGLRRADHGVRADARRARASAFSQSFGASGSQSRAVDSGQPADVVAFSTTPDMTRLVKDGIVSTNWDANPQKGFSSDSVVVFVVRKGNPKHITGWDDLVKPGVDVITPNPSTSGSARWNILAGYGAQLKEGKTPARGARLRQHAADQERQRPGLERERRAADVHQRQGRRAARLRERRDRGREGRRRGPDRLSPSRRS